MNPQNTNRPNPAPAPTVNPMAAAQARAMTAAQPATRPMTTPQTGLNPTAQVLQNPSATTYPTQQPAVTMQQPTQQGPFVQQPTYQQPLQQPLASQTYTPPATPQVVENPISTQATLMFSELRDSIVIMKDGSFRAVVACQSINFDLMSETEREGVEYSYQNFLNSLNFTIQILVRSQRVDIGPYIERLVKLRRDNDNMLLGVLMDDYINFIDILAQEANIMDKSFFIVIPYYASADLERAVEQTKDFFKAVGKNKNPGVTRINRDTYNKAIDELNNRVESVISGLFQIGIQSVRLNTKELSELYYNFNNPDTAVREPLVDFTKLATTYVKKGAKA